MLCSSSLVSVRYFVCGLCSFCNLFLVPFTFQLSISRRYEHVAHGYTIWQFEMPFYLQVLLSLLVVQHGAKQKRTSNPWNGNSTNRSNGCFCPCFSSERLQHSQRQPMKVKQSPVPVKKATPISVALPAPQHLFFDASASALVVVCIS
jgi:hypothetical protein